MHCVVEMISNFIALNNFLKEISKKSNEKYIMVLIRTKKIDFVFNTM